MSSLIGFFILNLAVIAMQILGSMGEQVKAGEIGLGDISGLVIGHLNLLVVILKLNLAWPKNVASMDKAVSSLVAIADQATKVSSIGCLSDGSPEGQAAYAMAGGILLPAALVVASVLLWITFWMWRRWGGIVSQKMKAVLPPWRKGEVEHGGGKGGGPVGEGDEEDPNSKSAEIVTEIEAQASVPIPLRDSISNEEALDRASIQATTQMSIPGAMIHDNSLFTSDQPQIQRGAGGGEAAESAPLAHRDRSSGASRSLFAVDEDSEAVEVEGHDSFASYPRDSNLGSYSNSNSNSFMRSNPSFVHSSSHSSSDLDSARATPVGGMEGSWQAAGAGAGSVRPWVPMAAVNLNRAGRPPLPLPPPPLHSSQGPACGGAGGKASDLLVVTEGDDQSLCPLSMKKASASSLLAAASIKKRPGHLDALPPFRPSDAPLRDTLSHSLDRQDSLEPQPHRPFIGGEYARDNDVSKRMESTPSKRLRRSDDLKFGSVMERWMAGSGVELATEGRKWRASGWVLNAGEEEEREDMMEQIEAELTLNDRLR